MNLIDFINALATRTATEFKVLRTRLGDNADLATTAKSTLVGSINEVRGGLAAKADKVNTAPPGGTIGQTLMKSANADYALEWATPAATGAMIDDTAPSSGKVYSSLKTDAQVAALINDTAPSASTTLSATKIAADITARVDSLISSAPGTLDTLNELAAALGDDPNFAATINTALANRLRVDAAQTLTAAQKAFGIANLGAATAADVGNVAAADFVAVFESALV